MSDDMPEIHGGAFAGISKALGSKKPSTPAPAKPAAPAHHEYSDASYSMASHAAGDKTAAPEA